MEDQNPYAPPQADLHVPATQVPQAQMWARGKTLIMLKDATLPKVCVKCNAPADKWLKKNLYWHHPVVYLVLLVNILVYAIVAMIVRKKATIHVGLCAHHNTRRVQFILGGIATMLLGFGGCAVGLQIDQPALIFGAVVGLIGIVVITVGARVVWPARIDDLYVWLNGVKNPALLEHLPQWPY